MSVPTPVRRRTLLAGAVAAAGTASLTGCNLAKGGNASKAGGGVTLNIWGGVPNETGPDELCQAFMDEHPDITVTYTRYVNDDEGNIKLDSSLTGGTPIDLYFSYSPQRLFQRAAAGVAVELTEKIAAEDDFAQFTVDAEPLGNFANNGKQYAIPASRAPQYVYINKTMLDDAGIKLRADWTVDEFVEVARELTRPKVFGTLTAPLIARPSIGPDYLYADGGERSNLDDPRFAEEIGLALSLQKEKIAMDRETIIAEQLQTFSQNPFIAGRIAMLIQSGHITRSIKDTDEYPHDFPTACMPIPSPHANQKGWNTGQIGDLISINPKSQHQDEAWEFAKFWIRNAGTYMVKGGRLPSLQGDADEDQILTDMLGDEELFDMDSWRSAVFDPKEKLPVDTIFTAGTEIDTLKEKLTDQVLLGDITVDKWVKSARRQSDAAIEKAS